MSAKDTIIGTAKQIVAEIVGDGGLAEEGARQSHESRRPALDPNTGGWPPVVQIAPPSSSSLTSETPLMDENRFIGLLGHAVLKVWPDLSRDAQERLFAAAVDDGVIADDLAQFLHDRHPKTAHPPKPTRLA